MPLGHLKKQFISRLCSDQYPTGARLPDESVRGWRLVGLNIVSSVREAGEMSGPGLVSSRTAVIEIVAFSGNDKLR
jgi:hypothetical protein